jgi:pyruvate dehydrogenase E1 component
MGRPARPDTDGALVNVMNETVDGEYQRYKAEDGAYVREHFFGKDPRTKALVADWTDEEIWALRRGGLDYRKIYAAYKVATELDNGKPTVILAKTIKGWTLGPDVEGRNATHQIKELTNKQLLELRSPSISRRRSPPRPWRETRSRPTTDPNRVPPSTST